MRNSESGQRMRVPNQWYVDAFGPLYPLIYAHRTAAAAVPEVLFAAQAVSLQADDFVLDLCCGAGRHLATLQERAHQLVGVDFSPGLLALAKAQVNRNVSLVRADMRFLPFTPCFDAVFSFFTSFGYFMEEADNVRTACELARVLKQGGRFFLDYLNPLHIKETLQPETVRTVDDFTVVERRWVDQDTERVNKRVEVLRDEEVVARTFESVRLYSLEEMKTILARGGLRIASCWGDYSGIPYAKDSPRMILSGLRDLS